MGSFSWIIYYEAVKQKKMFGAKTEFLILSRWFVAQIRICPCAGYWTRACIRYPDEVRAALIRICSCAGYWTRACIRYPDEVRAALIRICSCAGYWTRACLRHPDEVRAGEEECRTHQRGLQGHPLLGLPQGSKIYLIQFKVYISKFVITKN